MDEITLGPLKFALIFKPGAMLPRWAAAMRRSLRAGSPDEFRFWEAVNAIETDDSLAQLGRTALESRSMDVNTPLPAAQTDLTSC